MRKVKWGILGAAKIARQRVIPAKQKSDLCEVTAIASRDPDKAQAAAGELDIPKAYGSYESDWPHAGSSVRSRRISHRHRVPAPYGRNRGVPSTAHCR